MTNCRVSNGDRQFTRIPDRAHGPCRFDAPQWLLEFGRRPTKPDRIWLLNRRHVVSLAWLLPNGPSGFCGCTGRARISTDAVRANYVATPRCVPVRDVPVTDPQSETVDQWGSHLV
jgi:hypothetical protein